MTQQDVAEEVGYNSQYVCKVFSGNKSAGRKLAEKLGAVLNCQASIFTFGTPAERKRMLRIAGAKRDR
jgi:hypothetical protein